MMTESDIRRLLSKVEPFRPTVELYDINEIAGPQLVATVYGWQEPRGSYSEDYRADGEATIKAQVDAFLARDPTP